MFFTGGYSMKGVTKLPSGTYRYRLREGGKDYSFTDKRLLSQREIRERFTEIIGERRFVNDVNPMSFGTASKRFLNAINGPYSPATVAKYTYQDRTIESQFPDFYRSRMDKMSIDDLQRIANEYGVQRRSKTVSGLIEYIHIILHRNGIYIRGKVRYAQNDKRVPYCPTSEDVKRLFEAVKDTDLEIPVKLAALGLRRSEICGLTMSDFDGQYIHIHRTKIMTPHGPLIQERTKTPSSSRKVLLTHDLATLIKSRGVICKYRPDRLNKCLAAVLDANSMKRFTFHKLRHFYASQAHALGVPAAYIMRSGGWSTDLVLKSTYTHALDTEQEKNDRITTDFLDSLVTNA